MMARQFHRAAAVYARTLLGFATARNEVEILREEFSVLREVFAKTPGLERALTMPALSREKRAQILRPLADRASDPLKRLLGLLEIKGRLSLLPAIGEIFLALEEGRRQVRRARVVSALPFSAGQLESLSKGLSARSPGKTYLLHNEVDPSLIAGFRVEEDGLVTDTSLRSKLDAARRRLAVA